MNLKIELDGDMFTGMRKDLNYAIENVIDKMRSKECSDAAINLKLEIRLENVAFEGADGTARPAIIPVFKHKVQTVMQIKEEKSNTVGGMNVELCESPDGGWCFTTHEEAEGQMSMRDYM